MKERDKALAAMRAPKNGGIRLDRIKTDDTAGVGDKKKARALLAETSLAMQDLQYRLYAESGTALLIVFQAMDTAGKDGVIRKVIGPLNPQGVQVASFKRPTDAELAHDYLWRIHRLTPAKGMIRVFNRSHYEDVLVHRVHKLIAPKELERRYRQINDFERHLAENGTVILKFFLHISKDEQKRRLQARLDNPDKRWKFDPGDLDERKLWGKYREAYETALRKCSPAHAPWYVIPADNKWYRDWAVAEIILGALKKIKPRFPKEHEGLDGLTVE